MHGNQPVVEDSELNELVHWFGDVLHDNTSARRAAQCAKDLNAQHDANPKAVDAVVRAIYKARKEDYAARIERQNAEILQRQNETTHP
jgi:hypothetical protein